MIKKKFLLLEFKKQLRDFVVKKSKFTEVEKYVSDQLKQYPKESLNINANVFSVFKDIYTKEVVLYGEEYLKANSSDDKFRSVLAKRYKILGNVKRHNQLLGIKEFSLAEFKKQLKDFVVKKSKFTEVEKYVSDQLKQYPKESLNINANVFSVFKDIYTKEVVLYGEEYLKANSSDDKFRSVLAKRYKILGNAKRHSQLLGVKEFSIIEIKKEFSILKELKVDFKDAEAYVESILKKYPDRMVIIKVMFYAMFKDIYPNQIEKYKSLL